MSPLSITSQPSGLDCLASDYWAHRSTLYCVISASLFHKYSYSDPGSKYSLLAYLVSLSLKGPGSLW